MLKRIFVLAILIVCILWLVLSYLPAAQAYLPILTFTGMGITLAVSAVVALVIFLAIQFAILYRTVTTVREYQAKDNQSPFRLRIGTEFFWTALPILMTLGLAWASFALWIGRSVP